MVNFRAPGGWAEQTLKMGHILPRLGYKMGPPPDGDRLPGISPDPQGNPGQFMGLQNGPFLLANHGEICHILGIVPSPPLQARDFAPNMSNR